MPITEEFEWIFWFMGKIFEYVVYNFYCKIVLYWCFLSVILKFHLKKFKFKKSLDQRSNYENSIFSKPGSLKELSGSVDVLWRWNGSKNLRKLNGVKRIVRLGRYFLTLKKLEKTERILNICQARSMFCDAETSQKTWESWKESKTTAKLGTSMFCDAETSQKTWENWKDSKNLSGSVDVLWRWDGSKTWKNWKESKELSGLVDVLWRWNESKNFRKLKGV